MAKSKRSNSGDGAALDMTPMIDVVFQLIIFFVVTMRQEDILSHLDAMAPAGSTNSNPHEQLDLITIDVYNPRQGGIGLMFNQSPVSSLDQLDRSIERAARSSKESTVMLRCTTDSPHRLLVQALDLCNKHGMKNLAIFTIDAK